MNTFIKPILTLATIFILQAAGIHAQNFDTASLKSTKAFVSKNKEHNHIKTKERIPRKAATLSAVLPGLGQIYNRKIWKVPIVYATLYVTGNTLRYNINEYKNRRYAYKIAYNIQEGKDSIGSESYNRIDKNIKRWLDAQNGQIATNFLKDDRDRARMNVAYSALYFAAAWALNVIDATVDAHLSGFDVSPDLSLKIQPDCNILNRTAGLSLALKIK